MKSFGETVRDLRKMKKLPLRTVAEFLDIDQAILSKIERGQRKASRHLVAEFASYYRVDKNQLMISWLSDNLANDLQDEENAMEALQVAEDKIIYNKRKSLNQRQIIDLLVGFFRNDGRIAKAWIFGSFARGNLISNQDIDLMVRYSEKASGTLFDYADIKFGLENLLKQEIDIVEEGFVRPFALESIERDKILIYG